MEKPTSKKATSNCARLVLITMVVVSSVLLAATGGVIVANSRIKQKTQVSQL